MSCLLANNLPISFQQQMKSNLEEAGVIAGAVVGVLFIGLVITGAVLLLVIYRKRTKSFYFSCKLASAFLYLSLSQLPLSHLLSSLSLSLSLSLSFSLALSLSVYIIQHNHQRLPQV